MGQTESSLPQVYCTYSIGYVESVTNPVRPAANRIPPELRRAQILRCATELFAEKGFDLTTMDDVAQAAGVTKRTLYRYVSSKEALLYEIHDTFTDQSLVAGNPNNHHDAVAEFSTLVRRHVDIVVEHQKEISVFFEERKHLNGENERLIDGRRNAYERYGVSVIQFGIDSGAFVDLPPRPVGQAILGALTEIHRWLNPDGTWTAVDIANRYIDMFLNGVAVDRKRGFGADAPFEASSLTKSTGSPAAEKVRTAAIREFARAGYHATSLSDLASVADVTRGTVIYHAGYKQRLLEDIHRSTFDSGIQVLMAAEPTRGDAVVALRRMVIAHMRFLSDNIESLAVVNDNLRYLQPAARNRIGRLRDRWLEVFRFTIERGIADGELRDLDAGFLTRSLVGILNSTARWYDRKGRLGADELADIYARLFVFGLNAS